MILAGVGVRTMLGSLLDLELCGHRLRGVLLLGIGNEGEINQPNRCSTPYLYGILTAIPTFFRAIAGQLRPPDMASCQP